jgi:sugar transferase EpsL
MLRRNEVKRGITGWAQVNGRNIISWEDELRLDVWYLDHQSLWPDLRILWMTGWGVVRRHGINQVGMIGATQFMESASSQAPPHCPARPLSR